MLPIILALVFLLFPSVSQARVTPNDYYQADRTAFNQHLNNLSADKRQKMVAADQLLNQINQSVCDRFQADVDKMAAVLEEAKRREGKGGAPTRVAYGQGQSQLDRAAYWLNYAAEAIAYQRSQDYTPQFTSDANASLGVSQSMNNLQSSLIVLRGKVLNAKTEVVKTVTEKAL